MNFKWDIQKDTVPTYLKIDKLYKAIESGLKYVSKSCKNQVEFSRTSGQREIIFGFEDFGDSDLSNGNWLLVKPNKFAVTFNTQYKWGTLYQFWQPMSIKMITIHEAGHILGLYHHSNDKGSVMHSNPYLPYFTSTDKSQLIYLTNPNRIKQ